MTDRTLPRPRPLLILVCLAGVLGLAACQSSSRVDPAGAQARPYPFDASRAEVVDIQVFRHNTAFSMTNTTARDLGPATVWVNQRFSRDIPSFAPGQTVQLDLRSFVDEYGEPFRAGGFFATKDPDPVVLVQVQPAGEPELVGLIVVQDRRD